MYFNRKNMQQKNWRMIKKGKHFLFGCALVLSAGTSLVSGVQYASAIESSERLESKNNTDTARSVVKEESSMAVFSTRAFRQAAEESNSATVNVDITADTVNILTTNAVTVEAVLAGKQVVLSGSNGQYSFERPIQGGQLSVKVTDKDGRVKTQVTTVDPIDLIGLNTNHPALDVTNKFDLAGITTPAKNGLPSQTNVLNAGVEFNSENGSTIKLTSISWSQLAGGWKKDGRLPLAGHFVLAFQNPTFYQNIESISVNGTAFVNKNGDGSSWYAELLAKTFSTGAIGSEHENTIEIKLKNGQTLTSLGLQDTPISYSTGWVTGTDYGRNEGSNKLVAESIDNSWFIVNNTSLDESNQGVRNVLTGTKKDSSLSTVPTLKVLPDLYSNGDTRTIKVVYAMKPTATLETLGPANSFSTLPYLVQAIPEGLRPFITDTAQVYRSNATGDVFNKYSKLDVPITGNILDTRENKSLTLAGATTQAETDKIRREAIKNLYSYVAGQKYFITVEYTIKNPKDAIDLAKELNRVILDTKKTLNFETWLGRETRTGAKQTGSNQPGVLSGSYANAFLDTNLLTLNSPDKQTYDVSYADSTVKAGDTTQAIIPKLTDISGRQVEVPPTSSFALGTVPEQFSNVTIDAETGVISATVKADTPAGTELLIPVTVTYPDGTTATVSAKVTVEQSDTDKYEPEVTPIKKDFGQATTEDEVKQAVTVPNYPDGAVKPVITVDNPGDLPNGNVSGTFEIPVTVMYPDGTKDKVKVPITVGKQKDSDKYEPTATPIKKDFGKATTEDEVKQAVTVPNYPDSAVKPVITVDNPNDLPDGNTSGEFNVPVTVTYPDNTTDKVTVKVTVGKQKDADKYEPTTTPIKKEFGQSTTEAEVKQAVTVPNYPTGGKQPEITVDDLTKLPDGKTEGTFEVPVTVKYPDNTTDKVTVKVTVGKQKDADKYTPTTTPIEKAFGQLTTEAEVKQAVTVPNYPAGGTQPEITVDDPTKLPNGQTEGTFEVPVTVKYPDGTTDKTTVKVTVGKQKDADKYTPTTTPIEKAFGQSTTEAEVKQAVTVPDYPAGGTQPEITVDDPTKLPNGQTEGTFEVPVTVKYPDNTTDKVTVKVTVGKQKDADKYEPTTTPIEKAFGQATTEDEVKQAVTVPNYPDSAVKPVITVDNPNDLPDGNTSGEFNVPVTVTYPDNTTDKVTVKVTVGKQKDADKYEPTTTPIKKEFGQSTTEAEVKQAVTVPNYPAGGTQPEITVDDLTKLPDGQTEGTFEVPVTVKYPDNTTDKVTVKVTVGKQKDADKYTPTTKSIEKEFGKVTTEDEVKQAVTVPNYPAGGTQPEITVDDLTKLPDGKTEGTFEVPVTVKYPDGTTDKTTVKVTVGKQKDADKYTPTTTPIKKEFGQSTTEAEVKQAVTVPNYPTGGKQPEITVDDLTKLPNGQTEGTFEVPVTVTYPDNTTDKVTVKVTVGKQKDADKYTPTTTPIKKEFGKVTTEDEVKQAVTVPNYPAGGTQPEITVDDLTKLPNGQTEGIFEVPVTVKYPDGTTDKTTVKVTVGKQKDADKYTPETTPEVVEKGGKVDLTDNVKPIVDEKGNPVNVTVKDVTPVGTIDTNKPGDYIGKVEITYPDGSKEVVEVPIKVVDSRTDADKYTPETTPEVVEKGGKVDLTDNVKPIVDEKGNPVDVKVKDVTPSGTIDTNKPGDYIGKVEITYPDGSKEVVEVPIKVVDSRTDADKYTPETTPEVVEKGGKVDLTDNVKPIVDEKGNPVNVTVKDVTPVGTIDTNKPGDYIGKVEITYPDGSKEVVEVPVKVVDSRTDADKYTPETTPEVVEKGGKVDLTDNVKPIVDEKGNPVDVKVKDVTPSGTIDTNKPGDYIGKVEITYPDGSKEVVEVPIKVVDSRTDADKYTPETTPEVVEKGGKVDLTDNVKPIVDEKGNPVDVKVKDVTPSGTIDTNKPGDYIGKVEITYPDGSKEVVEVPVKVVDSRTDADKYTPETTPEVVEKGGKVDLTDNVKPIVDEKGNPVNVTVKDVTPVGTIDTNKPGDYIGKVEITYPDGSKETVNVPVKVVDSRTDADKYTPETTPEVVEKGGKVDLTDNVKPIVDEKGNPVDVKVKDVTPSGTIDTNKPGDYIGKVEITYPDGSKEVVEVPIKVVDSRTDADKYTPETTPEVVEKGGKVDLTDNVKPIVDEKGNSVNVTVKDVTPEGAIDVNTPGEYTGKVEITYPDGSKEVVEVPVKVVDSRTDADKYTPNYKDTTARPGDTVVIPNTGDKFPDGTKVVVVPTDLPKGTEVTVDKDGNVSVKVPNHVTPGTVLEIPVVITYPDGSVDKTTIRLTVTKTDKAQGTLPYTGEESNTAALVLGLATVGLGSALIAKKRRTEEK